MNQVLHQSNGWQRDGTGTGAERMADGARVQLEETTGYWVVLPPTNLDHPQVRFCPCCGARMNSERTAIEVAEATFPAPEHY